MRVVNFVRVRVRNLTALIGGMCIRDEEFCNGWKAIELTPIIFHHPPKEN